MTGYGLNVTENTENITEKELKILNEQMKNYERSESNSESESELEFSEPEPIKKQKSKTKRKIYPKNETTMIFLLKAQEELRLECDNIKMKYYKLKSKNDIMEERAHYTKLDMSNLIVERNTLKQDLVVEKQKVNGYFYTLLFSMLINVSVLGLTIYIKLN